MNYPDHLLKLIAILKKLPGVGTRNAERFAFHLLDWPEEKLVEMGQTIAMTSKNLNHCPKCHCLMEKECPFCPTPNRLSHRLNDTVCIVASPKDVFAIEQTHEFRGLYHVLGALFSPLHGIAPAPEALETLKKRIAQLNVKELILALDSTLGGIRRLSISKKSFNKKE